ncbi:hypothetical protein [Actibacterium sp. XHP0104]|uniref:hypothetical protein n=1 Tax=Actibacterium sp. XHP0104 TaxID=2984335 RepID=UPI0021E8D637|nr:hypothetical protein [Actibacterium sp. XHP0104]MCV2882621.1 hypothetical protein [Actibacterium sp. XHP0104]
MSDPLKQMEIEDVLSSIRRLVTEGTEQRVPDKPATPEKLILTPALRVEDAPAANAPNPQSAPTVSVATDSGAGAAQWDEISLEQRIAELEAAVAYVEEDWEPDGSEMERRDLSFEDIEAEEAADEDEAAPEDAELAEDDTAPIEEAEAPASRGPELVEPLPELEPEPLEPETIEITAEAVAEEEPLQETPEAPADEAEGEANMFSGDAPDMDVLDEETLRQLVNDIVRQELQGELGERITRNVRKLVRREINRALASRDFE